MHIFARLTKVNESDRTVEGIIASEAVDRSGEVFDYERSVPHFKSWSEGIAKATEGKNLGNVRVMHGKAVAGITKALNFDDAAKQITVKAEIVDDNEWNKVKKGCYTGFSIGGRYGDKWDDPVAKGVQRYEAIPNEYSLVDLPCNPEAQFTVIKTDGSEELRKFEATTDSFEAMQKWAESLDEEAQAMLRKLFQNDPATASAEMEKRYSAIADIVQSVEKVARRKDTSPKEGEDKYGNVEYADEKNKKYPLDTEKHIRAAWSYIHMPKNAAKYNADDVKAIKAKIAAAWKDKIDKDGPPEAEKMHAAMADRLAKNDAAVPYAKAIAALVDYQPELEKGLWTVSNFACLLEQLACMADGVDWEAEYEGDGSDLPMKMRAALKPLALAFLAMAEEEANEALHGQLTDEAMELAAKGELVKAMGFDDATVALTKWREASQQLENVQGDLTKAQADLAAATAERDTAQASLTKVTAERDETITKLTKLSEQHAELLKRAEPPKGAQRVVPVEKTVGITEQQSDNDDEPVKKADGSIDHVATAEKQMRKIYKR